MRTFEDIYREYCDWAVKVYKDNSLSYENLIDEYGENTAKSFLYKTISEKCYDKKYGLYFFVKFIIGDLLHLGYPAPVRYNNLVRKWDTLVKNHKKLCVECARGHGKTLFFSELFNIYDMYCFKFRRAILISASQEQANKILQEVKDIIDNNEMLSKKKGDQKWAAELIYYNGGYILAKGIGSEILGYHVDRIIVDDILSQRDDTNKITDAEVEDYIDLTLDPMLLNRKGQMIVVGTPKRLTDIFSTIQKRVREGSIWKYTKFAAILDWDKKIIQCPDRFTWEDLMDKKSSMGALKFAREYQLEVYSRETSLFPPNLIEIARSKGKEFDLWDTYKNLGPHWIMVFGVDSARAGTASADYTVVLGLAFNTLNQERYIVYFWRSKGLKIAEQAEHIGLISKKFNHPYFLVEENNMGADIIEQLIDKFNMNVEAFKTTGKTKWEELIRFLVLAFEHEKLVIPQGNNESKKAMEDLIDELNRFSVVITPAGNEKYEGLGAHDDAVIALALANRATQIAGIPFAITSGGRGNDNIYGALLGSAKGDTDIEKMIALGIIK